MYVCLMKALHFGAEDGLYIGLAVAAFVAWLWVACRRKKRKQCDERITFVFHFPNQVTIKNNKLMARLKMSQTLIASIVLATATGKPTTGEAGTAQWSSSDEAVATVAPNPDNELEATITPVGPGVAQIFARVDADRDAGEGEQRWLEASGAVEVVEDEAETMELRFSEPA